MTAVEIALACASRGWPCFPVRIEAEGDGKTRKTPLVRWSTEASTDPDTIRRWWRQHGNTVTAAGRVRVEFGVPTGSRSGLYVIDVDRPAAVEEAGLNLSLGRRVETNRPGGCHYFFGPPADGRPVRSSAGGGLDVRAEGGFVVVWHEPPAGTLQPLPAPVAEWARSRSGGGGADLEARRAEVWEPTNRHARLVSLAAYIRNFGDASEEEILGTLRVFNASRCPDHDDEDLQLIARSYAAKDGGAHISDVVRSWLKGEK